MSSICKTTPAITSESDLLTPYPNSIFPSSQLERKPDDERLTDTALESVYNRLVTQGKLVSNEKYKKILETAATQEDKTKQQQLLETVGTQEKQTMQAIQAEFCYMYVRYKYALEDLFNTLVRTSAGEALTAAQKITIERKIDTSRTINIKLNDIIQFTNFLSQKRVTEMRDQNSVINTMNTNIKDIYGKLQEQNAILRKEDSIADLRKRMVEYTQEKNQSATNLLSLYGFLNLVALGLLFYAARS